MASFMDRYEDIAIPDYIARLRRDASGTEAESLGTARFADVEAARRGIDAVRSHTAISLSRAMQNGAPIRNDGQGAYRMTVYDEPEGSFGVASDHVELDCHGLINTHVDGFNHFSVNGEPFGSEARGTAADRSIWRLAEHGVTTRAVHVDIPALRGEPWVAADRPVSGNEIEQALDQTGVSFMPGDALILDMGRDRFEAAGNVYLPAAESPDGRCGVGQSAAEWIAEHQVSALLWDMMDAVHPDEPLLSNHLLIWAIGQVVVDNCDFASARDATLRLGKHDGLLVIAPLRHPIATGSNVNPIWMP